MTEPMICAACASALAGRKTLMDYKGTALWLCERCAALAPDQRHARLLPRFKAIDQEAREAEAARVRYRTDIQADQIESLLVHAFLDLIGERKAAGKRELAATMETIATWLTDRTRLPLRPLHVQYLTLALRDGHVITVGGGGIGRPNTYDTTEAEMGLDAFWDQVDAFLLVWRLPNRMALLQLEQDA